MKNLIAWSMRKPKVVMFLTVLAVILSATQFFRMTVDTDPENMLPQDAKVRVFHQEMKKEFNMYDMIVVGVVEPQHPQGVFNVKTLNNIYHITEDIQKIDGVIASEIMSLSTRDNILQEDIGTVRFQWLMERPVKTDQEAKDILQQAINHPMFYGTVVSEDEKAMALYIPIERKNRSYEISEKIKKILQKYKAEEEYHITGLPIANDQFGVEMFKQMAISAPLTTVIIFLLMLFFFKSMTLIVAPMILAIVTVIITMGLLIACGFPVHIMSSMIPIFLMPIAVLDSIHILSDFFDKYPQHQDREKTIQHLMKDLFSPMLFTSLTSVAGFFSLSFSEIPPVQVFGVFVAVGIVIAWVLTMLFIPAYIMLMDKKKFEKFESKKDEEKLGAMDQVLQWMKNIALTRSKFVLAFSVVLVAISLYGITKIQVNDNPVRWFEEKHPIRVADQILNQHFAGTYEAYLVLEAENKDDEVFIHPEMLRYVETIQSQLAQSGLVGKTMSLVDITKKIYYELLGGDKAFNVVPDTKEAIAQCLISFENSHKPDDLWHLTTPDYSKLNVWLQLKSGDNKDMSKVVAYIEDYIQDNPPPMPLRFDWAGLTYINVVWQNNMVNGMLINFLGSFLIVLFMMLILFRSPLKALIAMIPLSVTIVFIYSLLGFFGKDYDMPVSVLSALTLGLSVDFAIHFIQRSMQNQEELKNTVQSLSLMFGGLGRAIIRNALVVAIGFLPLLVAPLVPYKTVGFFMFSIMAVSSFATMFILPAVIMVFPSLIEPEVKGALTCRCRDCLLIAIFIAITAVYILLGYNFLSWKPATLIAVGIVLVFAIMCRLASKRNQCSM